MRLAAVAVFSPSFESLALQNEKFPPSSFRIQGHVIGRTGEFALLSRASLETADKIDGWTSN
jgi:hypothetical protein